jgi:hypothetical protein
MLMKLTIASALVAFALPALAEGPDIDVRPGYGAPWNPTISRPAIYPTQRSFSDVDAFALDDGRFQSSSPVVTFQGKVIGRDPDPNVRRSLRRNYGRSK